MTNPLHKIPNVDKDMADAVPENLRTGLANYILYGVRPGGFLQAAISGNFCRAVLKTADMDCLRPLALFMANEMPIASHGSSHALTAWEQRGGLVGEVDA